ncbi:hypothetical protein SALBM311S_00340 [Streptomyces alboniger]
MRSSSAASGLRNWCEASATKARCCSRTSSTLSAISLNDRASLRSSGGPPAAATRDFRAPLAIMWVVVSRMRTGLSTQPVSRRAAPTASSIAAISPAPMTSQPCRILDRICPVGESVTTTATTSPSRMTGEATTRRPRCQGHTWWGSWLRRLSSASSYAARTTPAAGRAKLFGALAMALLLA